MKHLSILIAATLLMAPSSVPAESAADTFVQAPEFALKDLDGKTHRLSQFRGRVVFLDFWATWCGPCRMSTPALVALGAKMKGKKFSIIGVSLDDSTEGVREFADSMGVEHLILWGGGGTINETYRVRGIPAFYLIDKKGRVRKHYPGYAPRMEADWERSAAALLAEK